MFALLAAVLANLLTILFVDGYVFVADFVFVPDMPAPKDLSSSFLFEYLLFVLSKIMPAWVVQRLLLLAIFVTIFIAARKLLEFIFSELQNLKKIRASTVGQPANVATRLSSVWLRLRSTQQGVQIVRRASTGKTKVKMDKNTSDLVVTFGCALYLMNPYVYTRFMVGQWAVLMGYALLPLVLLATQKLLNNPAPRKSWLTLGGLLALTGILSIHFLGIAVIMTLITSTWWYFDNRRERTKIKPAAKSLFFSLLSFILLSSYWLVPLLLGKGKTADTISGFGASDFSAYTTTGDGVGIFGNLLRLQGFWGDNANLYLLPQDTHAWWWLPLVALFYLVIKGAFWSWKNQRFYFKVFATVFVIGLVVGSGIKAPLVGWFNQLLVDYVPLFGGYREPQKFAALIALAYVYFASAGMISLYNSKFLIINLKKVQQKVERLFKERPIKNFKFQITNLFWVIFLIPIFLVPDIWFNANGQLKTGDYPEGWYNSKQVVENENKQGKKVLYLPWHLYMPFSFSGGVIANPAPKFFGQPYVSSSNPELAGLNESVGNDDSRAAERKIVNARLSDADLERELKAASIGYVIVVKEFDWRQYDYIYNSKNMKLLYEDQSIAAYEVTE